MNRVGIYTFHNVPNYGAALQAYSLMKKLESYGCMVSIVDYQCKGNRDYDLVTKDRYYKGLKTLRGYKSRIAYHVFIRKVYKRKMIRFSSFQHKYLRMTPYSEGINNEFDKVVYGSDQIWNPLITNGYDVILFGYGTKKAISYAASIGDLDNIQEAGENEFLKLIRNFQYISVREESLRDFITSNVDDIRCSHVIDPVFLPDRNLFLSLLKEGDIDIPKEKYLLIYQLERYPETYKIATRIAKSRNLKILEICGTDYKWFHSKRIVCDAGPLEFLKLIYNASYVVTNTFHGTAFSILFERNFNSITSRSGKSRVHDLLVNIGLEDRIVGDGSYSIDDINYSESRKKLEVLIDNSNTFLKEAIGS